MEVTARERWSLSEPALGRLLESFDADPDRAAARYEEIRRKLARFFEWRGCPPADEHADEVLDRVARRLHEGVAIANVGAYAYGIARMLLHEVAARVERQRVALAELAVAARPVEEDGAELRSLDRCLAELDPGSRALILEYYQGERRDRQAHRREMAARLGIAPNALRIRLHRIRRTLESCLARDLEPEAGETKPRDPSLPAGGRDVVG
jgi:DNA-directed RNA polymerase specialized sigma24 family protein